MVRAERRLRTSDYLTRRTFGMQFQYAAIRRSQDSPAAGSSSHCSPQPDSKLNSTPDPQVISSTGKTDSPSAA
jgi:hypothetical protein